MTQKQAVVRSLGPVWMYLHEVCEEISVQGNRDVFPAGMTARVRAVLVNLCRAGEVEQNTEGRRALYRLGSA